MQRQPQPPLFSLVRHQLTGKYWRRRQSCIAGQDLHKVLATLEYLAGLFAWSLSVIGVFPRRLICTFPVRGLLDGRKQSARVHNRGGRHKGYVDQNCPPRVINVIRFCTLAGWWDTSFSKMTQLTRSPMIECFQKINGHYRTTSRPSRAAIGSVWTEGV